MVITQLPVCRLLNQLTVNVRSQFLCPSNWDPIVFWVVWGKGGMNYVLRAVHLWF